MDRSRNRLRPGDRVVALGYCHNGEFEPEGVVRHLYAVGVLVEFPESHRDGPDGEFRVLPAHQVVHKLEDCFAV